ncbi:MAG TPA: thiol:disulfide interchange protein DsbA/DsbL [Usitatibacteraceae bacterium]|nr:thiol:disulfide interchange protein DsbA/DsbL [Usitatibacteraceae bacterium]
MTFAMMNTLIRRAALAAVALLASMTLSAQEVKPLNPPQPVENDGKIEVLEFFAYGCIHCAQLEPRLKAWVGKLPADVKFRAVPAAFASRGIDSIPIFYTLEAMGVLDKLHQKIFDAANVENVMLGHQPTLLKWLEKQGVKAADYEQTLRSFSVQTKIRRATQMNSDYKIHSTPSLVVDGRWVIEGGGERALQNADDAIERARQRLKASQPPAAPAAAAAKKK